MLQDSCCQACCPLDCLRFGQHLTNVRTHRPPADIRQCQLKCVSELLLWPVAVETVWQVSLCPSGSRDSVGGRETESVRQSQILDKLCCLGFPKGLGAVFAIQAYSERGSVMSAGSLWETQMTADKCEENNHLYGFMYWCSFSCPQWMSKQLCGYPSRLRTMVFTLSIYLWTLRRLLKSRMESNLCFESSSEQVIPDGRSGLGFSCLTFHLLLFFIILHISLLKKLLYFNGRQFARSPRPWHRFPSCRCQCCFFSCWSLMSLNPFPYLPLLWLPPFRLE